MSGASFRQAELADLPHIESLTLAAYAPYTEQFGAPPLPVTEDYRPRIAAGEVWLLGTEALIVLERHADHGLIYSLAVSPAAQGMGYGSRMLRFADETVAGWGLAEIRLYTNSCMTRNIALYTASGYRETGRRTHPLRPGFILVDMSKPLTPRG